MVALLETLELLDSAKRKGHFALYSCLVLGHTKYSGVQRVYCNPFPAKTFHGCHRMDFVMIRPPGIDNGAFVLSLETVWYARVLLLFSASASTDTGSKSFECALVSTLESYDDPENGNYINYDYYTYYVNYSYYTNYLIQVGWNLWALELCTSLITGSLFSTSSPFKVFWENLQLYLLETPEPFRTTCATSFRVHPVTASWVPETDAGCGLSTRGHWDGPVTCN